MRMSLFSVLRLSLLRTNHVISAHYATYGKGKPKQIKVKKVTVPVEKDVEKLVTYCCGLNYHMEEEPVKLKPDDQYPEWLWNLRTTKVEFSEMDPNTKQYWKYIRKEGIKRRNQMIKLRKF